MKFVLDKNFSECYCDYSEWNAIAEKEANMSEKEKEIAAQLAELPPDVQDKFLLMAQGAAMAVEAAREAAADLSAAAQPPAPEGEAEEVPA